MKLTDKPINIQFGGGCPICKGNNTLTIGGSIFKRSVECSACGSKFESRFGLTSPRYELVEGSGEFFGKELEIGDWKKLRKGEIDKTDVENRDKQIRESCKTEKSLSYLIGGAVLVGLSAVLIVSISLDYSTLMATSKSLMLVGVMFLILGCIVIGISIGLKRFMTK
jgi:transposase-like protein